MSLGEKVPTKSEVSGSNTGVLVYCDSKLRTNPVEGQVERSVQILDPTIIRHRDLCEHAPI